MKYAADTTVDVARTRAELERLVLSEGASRFTTSSDEDRGVAMVAFRLHNHSLLFELKLPKRDAQAFHTYKLGSVTKRREPAAAFKLWEQACRAQWRALFLAVKAKLVSVAAGVETFEDAFLSAIVVNDSGKARRFGELAVKAIQESYVRGGPPQLMAGGPL